MRELEWLSALRWQPYMEERIVEKMGRLGKRLKDVFSNLRRLTLAQNMLLAGSVIIACIVLAGGDVQAEPADTWKAHPPEYYKAIRDDVAGRIARQLETADLRGMGWYADVRETVHSIEVERETWSMLFDKKTAGVKSAVVRGRKLDKGLALADVMAVDGKSKKFFRSCATDGTLSVKEDNLHVYLDGAFTPRSRDGKAFPVRFEIRYDIYKSCGLVAVWIKAIDGKAKILELGAIHTLGRTPEPLKYFQHSNNSLDGKRSVVGSCADSELIEYKDGVYYETKFGAALWSDGAIGLQAIPLPETYLNTPPKGGVPDTPIPQPGQAPLAAATDVNDPRYSPDRFMVVAVKNNASYLDFVFMRRTESEELAAGYEMGWTFSVLPFRWLRPRPVMHSAVLHPLSWHPGVERQYAPKDVVESAVRKTAADGADLMAHFLTHNAGGVDGMLMPDNKTILWCRQASEIVRSYGLICQESFIHWIGLSESQMQREQLLTGEELAVLRNLAGTPADVDGIPCDSNARGYRGYILGGAAIAAKELGVRGIYFDLGYVYGSLPGNPSQIEGNVKLMEELRLLLDSYGESIAITWHTGGQVTPAESLADFTLPGEPLTGAGQYFLTPGQNAIAYNSLLIGSNVVPWEMGNAYQTDKPEVWKQFLANGNCSAYIGGHSTNVATKANMVRYLYPLKIFDVERSALHSWQDADFSNYVETNNATCMVNAYVRKGETLLTACLPPLQGGKVKLLLNASALRLTTSDVLVYNTVQDKAQVLQVEDGRIAVGPVDLTKEPAIFYVTELKDPKSPLIFWHDHNLEILEQTPSADPGIPVNKKVLEVRCRFKVARAEGETAQFRLYRGEWGPVFSAFLQAFRQVADDAESRVCVIEVKGQPLPSPDGPVSQDVGGKITFSNPLPGWR